MVTEAHVCKHLALVRYMTTDGTGRKLNQSPTNYKCNALTITPLSHMAYAENNSLTATFVKRLILTPVQFTNLSSFSYYHHHHQHSIVIFQVNTDQVIPLWSSDFNCS